MRELSSCNAWLRCMNIFWQYMIFLNAWTFSRNAWLLSAMHEFSSLNAWISRDAWFLTVHEYFLAIHDFFMRCMNLPLAMNDFFPWSMNSPLAIHDFSAVHQYLLAMHDFLWYMNILSQCMIFRKTWIFSRASWILTRDAWMSTHDAWICFSWCHPWYQMKISLQSSNIVSSG